MNKPLHILILEDSESDVLLLTRNLKQAELDFDYTVVKTAQGMQVALTDKNWDIILSDYSMPSFGALQALNILKEDGLDTPFIIISGTVGEDVAVTAMKAGAADFFSKDNLQRLVPAVERELREAEERRKRREVEIQYRQAEARFAKAFRASPVGIAISRLSDGKAIDINQRFTEMFGYQRDDIIGKNALELNLWSENEQRHNILQQLKETGSIQNVEVRLRRASGEEGYALLSAEVIDLDNEPCILTMVHDITDRKEAEEQIKRSNDLIALLRDIAVASNEASDINDILQFVIDRVCTYANWDIGHAYIISEQNGHGFASSPIWHIAEDDCFQEFRRFTETFFDAAHTGLIRRVLDSGKPVWIENVSINADFVRAEVAAQCGLQGGYAFPIIAYKEVVGVFEFFSKQAPDDIAREVIVVTTHIGSQVGRVIERQGAAAALQESEKHFRLLAENSTDLISRHTPDGVFLYASPACKMLFGYEPEELIGSSAYELFHAEDVAQVTVSHELVLNQQTTQGVEYRAQRKDGKYVWLESLSHAIVDSETQEVVEIHTTTRDITQRKRLLEEERIRRMFAEVLHEITTEVLTNNLDLDAILERILNHAGNLTPCDTATLMIVEDGIARVAHCYGFDKQYIPQLLNIRLEVVQTPNLREMAQSKKPLFIKHTNAFAGWQANVLPIDVQFNAYIGAPIFIGEELFGFINLDSNEANRFTTDHVNQLALLSAQAASAIHNAQLYNQIQRYTKRLELLHEIDKAILRADDPQAIGHAVIAHLQTLIDVHSASITLFDLDRNEYTVLATTDSIPARLIEGSRHKFENPDLITIFEKNQIYIVNNLADISDPTPTDMALTDAGIRSYARIPLSARGKVIGSINFRAIEASAFTENNLDIAKEVSVQLAIAIENSRLLEMEQHRNIELTALHQASLQLTRTLDLESVLNTVVDYAILLVETHDAHIFLYDGKVLTFGAAQWDGKKRSKPISEPRPEGLTYTVARTGQHILIADMQEHPLYKDSQKVGGIIALPLQIGDSVVGVMTLVFDESRQIGEHYLRLLELLADQAAVALHNARLYKQVQNSNDVLEQRVIERTQELRQAKDRAEAILNTTSDLIIITDSHGRILKTNPSFKSHLGYSNNQLLKQTLANIFAEEKTLIEDVVQEVVKVQSQKRLELTVFGYNHSHIPVDALISSFRNGDGQEIVCSLRDISLLKKVEAELRVALKKERELNELKTSFTSLVSHEFRTPLAVIQSSVDLLTRYYDRMDAERRSAKLAMIGQQVRRLVQLMDDVLMITRSDTVGFQCNPQYVDLRQMCKEIIEEVQIRHSGNDNVTFSHSADCQQVLVDQYLFSHILQNLVSNALKYTPNSGKISIELSCIDHELKLKVEDEGIGIPLAHQDKLFEAFQRASNAGDIQGTGIGMTIVKRAVDAHRGTLEFTSQENVGTTFTVTLPIEES